MSPGTVKNGTDSWWAPLGRLIQAGWVIMGNAGRDLFSTYYTGMLIYYAGISMVKEKVSDNRKVLMNGFSFRAWQTLRCSGMHGSCASRRSRDSSEGERDRAGDRWRKSQGQGWGAGGTHRAHLLATQPQQPWEPFELKFGRIRRHYSENSP